MTAHKSENDIKQPTESDDKQLHILLTKIMSLGDYKKNMYAEKEENE